MKHHLAPLLLLGLIAAAPADPTAKPVDLRTQVQQLQAEVDELKAQIARIEALLTRQVAGGQPPQAALHAVDRAEIAKGLKEHHYVVGMTIAQAKQVAAANDVPIEQSADHQLINGRDRTLITIKDATGLVFTFDEAGILTHFGR